MVTGETLTASMEDYLEAICHLVYEKQVARTKDIAKSLKVNCSSVTGALRSLTEKNLINYEPYGLVTLTSKGEKTARDVIRRHEVLRDFFVKVLSVNKSDAEIGACKMEHVIPYSILERLVNFVEFIEVCPRGGTDWIKNFDHYCSHGKTMSHCEKCISSCLNDLDKKNHEKGQEKMETTLDKLKPGQKGKIKKIKGRGQVNKRIVDMGVTPGTLISVERVAPLGDPIETKVKGYHLSLRKDEASTITVEIV